jgi:purine-nucleoside phosphorylase
MAMEGRCHFYEGYSCDEVAFPVRVMRELGAPLLIVSNASGGVNPQLRSGDIVVLADHICWMGRRLFAGWLGAIENATRAPYDEPLIERALAIARRENFSARRGVYVSVLGPNYETRAEYRCFRRIGGDVVGMSTVPEILAAARCGMRVLGLSVVTNVAKPDALAKTSGQEVIDIAARSEFKLRQIVLGVLAQEKQPGDSSSPSCSR